MSRRRPKIDAIIDPFWKKLDNWPEPSVREKDRNKFNFRKQLITAYFESDLSVNQILSGTGILPSTFYYLLNRALKPDGKGGLMGWRGVLPNIRLSNYRRISVSNLGYAGRFQKFMRDHPSIANKITKIHLSYRTKNRISGGRSPQTATLEDLHRLCIEAGLTINDYPLCLATGGREGLRLYLREVDRLNAQRSSKLHGGDSAALSLAVTSSRDKKRNRPTIPYSHVECDAHRMDLMLIVFLKDDSGISEPYLLERVWLYVVYDVVSQCILGYYLSLNPEPGIEDFLTAIAKSLIPWKPKKLTIDDLQYPEEGGLPSGSIKRCEWQCFERIKLDNALVHASPWAQEQIMKTVGCSISLGKPSVPVARACVERLFKTLNQHNWHRIGNTTGSHTRSPLRKDPGLYAKKHQIALGEIEQVLDVIVAQHNTRTHRGAPLYGKRTPLGYMACHVQSSAFIPRALNPKFQKTMPLLIRPKTCTVRGDENKGRRPYIQFQNAIYRNHILDDAWDLIGKKVILELDITKAHVARAHVDKTGADLHVLMAQRPWSSPHTLRQRKAITLLKRRGEITIQNDAIRSYERFKAKEAQTSKRAVNALVNISRINTNPENQTSGSKSNPIDISLKTNISDFKPSKKKGWILAGKARQPGRKS